LIDPCSGAATCTTYNPGPFSGNVIPTNRINPTAKALLSLWPAPTNANILNNYVTNYGAGGNQNQNIVRVDHKINDAQHVFVRFSQWNNLNQPADPLGTGLCVDRCTETMTSKAIAIGYNHVFTPTLIGNMDVSAIRFNYLRTPKNSGFDFTTIGWPAAFNTEIPASLRTPPTPDVLGMSDNAMATQGQSYIVDHDTQYWFSPYLTVVRGRHTYQMGSQYEITLDDYAQSNIVSGSLGFNGSYTQDYDTVVNPNQNSLAFADFLLGWAQNPSNIGNHFFGDAVIPNLVAGKQKSSGRLPRRHLPCNLEADAQPRFALRVPDALDRAVRPAVIPQSDGGQCACHAGDRDCGTRRYRARRHAWSTHQPLQFEPE
jgi:hypothetical protein